MPKKSVLLAAVCVCLVVSVAAYALLASQFPSDGASDQNGDTNPQGTPLPASTPTADSSTNDATSNPTSNQQSGGGGSTQPTVPPTVPVTPEPTLAPTGHEDDHENAADYVWSSADVMDVQLNGDSISTSSPNAVVSGTKITLTGAGTFKFTGSLSDGQICVDTDDKGTVRLILSNVDIGCSSSSAIYVQDAKKVILILEDGTANTVRDARAKTSVDPNAAIFSAADLTIYGSGALTILGNSNDAITCRDGLIIKSGTVTATSQDDGVRGRDYLIIRGGFLTVNSGADGLISDNNDADKGFIDIDAGTVQVTSGGDSINAAADVTIDSGTVTVTAGGGSGNSKSAVVSMKGIKGFTGITVNGGTINVNSADDALHSNGTITLKGGSFSLSTADDGIHADSNLLISSTNPTYPIIDIHTCYEGIESGVIAIDSGTIHINARDDGINCAGGNDGSGLPGPWAPPGSTANSNYFLYVNGGYIVVSAVGDGMDVNGGVVMTGGTLIINGPTSSMNGAIDYDTSFNMTGGFIVGVGSSGMAMAPSTTSTQNCLLIKFGTQYRPTTYSPTNLIHIQSTSGTEVVTFKAEKIYQSISISSPALTSGTTYTVSIGGSSTGTLKDSIYEGGTYTPGTLVLFKTFSLTGIVTKINA